MASPGLPESITAGVTTGHVTDHEKIHDLLNEFDSAAQAQATGDLLVFQDGLIKRLPVGSDGQVLTADSGETAGVKWAAGGGGGGGGAASVPWMRTPVTPPDTGWSWVNQGTATETVQDGGARVVAYAATGSNNLVGRVRAHPGTPMKLTARCDLMPTATFAACGIGFRESSTGKIRVIYMRPNTTGSSPLVVESWDSPTSAPGSGVVANWNQRFTFPWLQIEDNGTNLIFRYSEYGFEGTWRTLSTEGRTAYMSGGPDEIGWFVRDNNGAVAGILSSWEVA